MPSVLVACSMKTLEVFEMVNTVILTLRTDFFLFSHLELRIFVSTIGRLVVGTLGQKKVFFARYETRSFDFSGFGKRYLKRPWFSRVE